MLPIILDLFVEWAKADELIRGVALIGSHARGEARPDSDIDLLLLTGDPDAFRTSSWLPRIEWARSGTCPTRWVDEEYGAVWPRRIWLGAECELEVAFAKLQWADLSPVDSGTRRIIAQGCRIFYDPDGLFERLISVGPKELGLRR